MAKLRSNHSKSSSGSGNIVKVGLFSAIIGALFMVFNQFTGGSSDATSEGDTVELEIENEPIDTPESVEGDYLPEGTSGQIIRRRYYTLSYSEEHEQAEWVAYVLYKKRLQPPFVERYDEFMEDSKCDKNSASLDDYRNSGYDRGHLVPAADMAFNERAMRETFYLSNISPQGRNFNGGIWRELEELTRSWAKRNTQLYVVSGPVLALEPKGSIGYNEVSVPAAYFKVLLDLKEPQLKSIGFVIPNEVSFEPLYKFAVSVDYVEEVTGIDFFPNLLSKELEEEIEASFNSDLWPFSKTKFDKRVEQWNKR